MRSLQTSSSGCRISKMVLASAAHTPSSRVLSLANLVNPSPHPTTPITNLPLTPSFSRGPCCLLLWQVALRGLSGLLIHS